jgi:hypothetical protein
MPAVQIADEVIRGNVERRLRLPDRMLQTSPVSCTSCVLPSGVTRERERERAHCHSGRAGPVYVETESSPTWRGIEPHTMIHHTSDMLSCIPLNTMEKHSCGCSVLSSRKHLDRYCVVLGYGVLVAASAQMGI